MSTKSLLAILLVGPLSSAAIGGGPVKIKAFIPEGPGITENNDGDGLAILNFKQNRNETQFEIAITDFLPNTVYGVKLDSDLGGFSSPTAITTNSCGSGRFDFKLPFDRTSNPIVYIYRWDGDTDTVDDVSDDEIRASGTPNVVEIDDFDPAGPGVTENPHADGKAVIRYNRRKDETTVRVKLDRFKPNTTYGVKLDSDLGGFSAPQAITTNCSGEGRFRFALPFDRTRHAVVTIYVWDGNVDTVDDVSATEIRAVGS